MCIVGLDKLFCYAVKEENGKGSTAKWSLNSLIHSLYEKHTELIKDEICDKGHL